MIIGLVGGGEGVLAFIPVLLSYFIIIIIIILLLLLLELNGVEHNLHSDSTRLPWMLLGSPCLRVLLCRCAVIRSCISLGDHYKQTDTYLMVLDRTGRNQRR